MGKDSISKQCIVDEIELRLRLMVKYHSEGKEGCFDIAQRELDVLSSFAYQYSILDDAEYARYMPLQYVLFNRFKNPDET